MFEQIIIGILACIIFFFVGYCVGSNQACNAFLDSADEFDLYPEYDGDEDIDYDDNPYNYNDEEWEEDRDRFSF